LEAGPYLLHSLSLLQIVFKEWAVPPPQTLSANEILKQIESDPSSAPFDQWVEALDGLAAEERKKIVSEFDKVASKDGKYAEAHNNWGIALANLERFEEASEQFRRAVEADPQYAVAIRNEGLALANLGKYDEAIQLYEQTLEVDPQNAAAYNSWGNALKEQGKGNEAAEKFRKATELNPTFAVAYNNWANTLSESKNNSEAVKQYLQAIKLDSDSASYENWAKALGELSPEEREKATREFDELAKKDPKYADAYNSWGAALHNEEKYAEAIAKYQKATEVNPEHLKAHYNWGLALANQEKYEEAIGQFEKVIRIDPDYAEAYNSWGNALKELGKNAEALEKFHKATDLKPDFAVAFNSWAETLYEEKNYLEAVKQYLQAIKIDPNSASYENWIKALAELSPEEREQAIGEFDANAKKDRKYASAYNSWGAALQNEEKNGEAIENYRKATEVDPQYLYAHYNWGLALANQKKYDEAIELYKKTLGIKADYVDAYNSWGLVLASQKKFEEAIEQYRKALQIEPKYADAYNSWGLALADQKKYEEAIRLYGEAVGIKSDFTDAYNSWGNALADQKKHKEAIAQYRKAIEIDSNYVRGYHNWGLVLADQGYYDKAIEKFKKCIEIDPKFVYSYTEWGLVLIKQEKFEEAAAKAEEGAKVNPGDADAVLTWGEALLNQGRDSEAGQKFQSTLRLDPEKCSAIAQCYFLWGNSLANKYKYRIAEAIQSYEKAVDYDLHHPYANHQIAHHLERQGRFRESWRQWECAGREYAHGEKKAKTDRDANYFSYFGWVMNKLSNPEAEIIYEQGLEIDSNHVGILTGLVDLYLERREDGVQGPDGKPDRDGRSIAHAKARESYLKCERLLKMQATSGEPTKDSCLQLGQLYLRMEEFEAAKTWLLRVIEQNSESAEAHTSLGVLYSLRENYGKAIDCFQKALRLDPDDLTVRSNLAEAFLCAKFPDKARAEYNRILSISSNHIESEIGLGRVCLALADAGNPEFYEEAVHHFTRAIEVASRNPAFISKRLKPRDWAGLYYLSAYAKVKLHGSSKGIKDGSFLRRIRGGLLGEAMQDLNNCLAKDPDHFNAQTAKRKIAERLDPTSVEVFLERIGPYTILVASGFLFVLSQVSYLYKGRLGELKFYVPMTFGSLVMMIAGLCLPRLLKLKVAGIELEKSSGGQIAPTGAIEISNVPQVSNARMQTQPNLSGSTSTETVQAAPQASKDVFN
jgi:tetratricopeptide (TPR) repeat protein